MATNREYNDMLNEHITDNLMTEEVIKRDWFLSNVKMKKNWKGGTIPVPFEGAKAGSISYGSLTASNDISMGEYVRGSISTMPEAWASLKVNQRDLQEHDGKIPETTFLDVVPRLSKGLARDFAESLSLQMTCGPHIALVTDATDAATGILIVDHVERFTLHRKYVLDDGDSSSTDVYPTAINMNTSAVTFSATSQGAAANLSAYSVAQTAKFYEPGAASGTFTSMRLALLSEANGGAASLHNKSKLLYPYLQCINVLGSSVTSSNIVDKLFDFYLDVRKKGRGTANKLLMSYKNWGSVMKSQQIQKGQYKVVSDPKRSEFGWFEMTIASTVNGDTLSIVAIQEFDDDIIVAFDPSSVEIESNGGIVKHKTPDGNSFYVVRNTTGYEYITDWVFRGEVKWLKPTANGVLYSISY